MAIKFQRYQMTTQKQVRESFWKLYGHEPGITKRKSYAMHHTDTRCAFCDYVDQLSKAGLISQELASRVTL